MDRMARSEQRPGRLVWKPADPIRRMLARGIPRGGYLTLASVDLERHEQQLGRLDGGSDAQAWLVGLVNRHIEIAGDARFRIRRWTQGGKADGSVSFRVSRPHVGAQPPSRGEPAPTRADPPTHARLNAVEAGLADILRRLEALEAHAGESAAAISDIGDSVAQLSDAIVSIGRLLPDGEE
jgi:hypothetical protein